MGGRLPAQDRGSGIAMTAMLPTEFADLERFSDWCLAERAGTLRETAGQFDGRDAGLL